MQEFPGFKRWSYLNGCGVMRCFSGRNRRPENPQAKRGVFCAIVRPRALGWLILLLSTALSGASPQTLSPVPAVETIVARMAQARTINQIRIQSYSVTREYELFGKERQSRKVRLIADVTFVPPHLKNFSIHQSEGTGLGEKIVRRILASEVEIAKDCSSTDFTPVNYDFLFRREENLDNQNCYVLQLLPRRNEKNLLNGNIWVDANTYLVRRAEGKLAKTPSWWVRDIWVALFYADVGGMWLQTASEGTAMIRIFGPYTITSRDLHYEMSGNGVSAGVEQIGDLSFSKRE